MANPRDPNDFKAYQELADKMGSPAAKKALHEIAWSSKADRVVPLVDARMQHTLLRHYKRIAGVAIVGMDSESLGIAIEAVPPEDMSERDFVQLCRNLNAPLQKPLMINVGRLLTGLSRQQSLITGVTYMTDGRSNGAAFLHVPEYFTRDGAEEVLKTNLNDSSLRDIGKERLSTRISSVLFDGMTGAYLGEPPAYLR